MTRSPSKFPVVGVGASAGGIEALEGFFQGVPPNPGLAFIVATHLSPDRESMLHEIIARHTDLSVAVAEHDVAVRPNCVYVLPADAVISLSEGRLALRGTQGVRRERKPIDILFSSLAIDQGEYAASVVLSGGDGDGALGTKAVKERGGLTFAQIPGGHGPKNASMPDSAISTGYVDFALPVEEMGARLADFAQSLPKARRDIGAGAADAHAEISAIIRGQIGHDFSGHRPNTFLRRVQRRMQIVQAKDWPDYIQRLRADPGEVMALFRDLLISVTSFFRDAEAFDSLRDLVVAKLFEDRASDGEVRVWVPGCATGEEVYSIAILLREGMDGLATPPRVKVFATDIDETALRIARAARYPDALLDSVSPKRRERFFIQDGGGHVLSKEIRELCIFSPHSLIRDPPFSRLDLICCRNLLIYFGSDIQNQVLPTFRYALRNGGYLFLGLSEGIDTFADLFEPVDRKHRIFRRRDTAQAAFQLPLSLRRSGVAVPPVERRDLMESDPGAPFRQALEARILDQFAPAHVLVNGQGDVVHFSARTSRYLELAPGAPTRQLMSLARKGLRPDLRSAFREVVESKKAVTREGLSVTLEEGQQQRLRLTVEPLLERRHASPLYLVVFTDEGPPVGVREEQRAPEPEGGAVLPQERELSETRARLRSLIEEYETALGELRWTNEESASANEELQSGNEELEASKQEQQSLIEELNTVNAELMANFDALDRANSDLRNLFESTQIPTLFLDRKMAIRGFTPEISGLFHIIAADRGRRLTDLNSRLSLPGFFDDIHAVFDHAAPIEREVADPLTQRHYTLRIAPYRTLEGATDGVVVTFIDVTRLTQAQAHQQTLIWELNHRVKNMLMVVLGIAEQTHRSAPGPEAFLGSFIGRLQAMARSYELLSRANWTETSLEELVRSEVSPFGGERVDVSGPPVGLKPRQALSMGMILHELAINAAKHGALSLPSGTVSIEWTCTPNSPGSQVDLYWRETGLDPPEPREGFGLKLVEREMSYNLDGKATVTFTSNGLQAHLSFSPDDT